MAKHVFRKRDDWSYAETFDRLMGEHFGEKFKTEWNIFAGSSGNFVTVRENGKKPTPTMIKVGRTISNALAAGQEAYE